jgi:hypothetical protein
MAWAACRQLQSFATIGVWKDIRYAWASPSGAGFWSVCGACVVRLIWKLNTAHCLDNSDKREKVADQHLDSQVAVNVTLGVTRLVVSTPQTGGWAVSIS